MDNKEFKPNMNSDQSYEEDVRSNYSEISHLSAGAETPTQVEEEPPIRVRDMINLYNFATKKNQELAHAKSIYFGSNMDGAQQQDQECCDAVCHKMPATDGLPTCSRSRNQKPGTFRVTSSEDHTSVHQSLESDAAGGETIEKSYHSKTTIRRTEQGVRIIIDIFFEKNETEIDIIGSRVETDIPESRILADFQQLSLASQAQQIKQPPNV